MIESLGEAFFVRPSPQSRVNYLGLLLGCGRVAVCRGTIWDLMPDDQPGARRI